MITNGVNPAGNIIPWKKDKMQGKGIASIAEAVKLFARQA